MSSTHQSGQSFAVPQDPSGDNTGPIHAPLYLTASDSGAVTRVTRGSCDKRDPERAVVWVARRAGTSLQAVKVPRLQEALAVDRPSDKRIRIVGTRKDCETFGWVSTDSGKTWKQARFIGPDLGRYAWRPFVLAARLEPGTYTLASRATDAKGTVQDEQRIENASGYVNSSWRDHALQVTVA